MANFPCRNSPRQIIPGLQSCVKLCTRGKIRRNLGTKLQFEKPRALPTFSLPPAPLHVHLQLSKRSCFPLPPRGSCRAAGGQKTKNHWQRIQEFSSCPWRFRV